MRRKSERTSSKKRASPEKKEKLEKSKKSRTSRRNRKHSSSSESEPEDNTSKQAPQVSQTESAIPPKTAKEVSPEGEESQEQVWHVKTTETSGDIGEIQKLKICLARPPSTPERADRSPRSKRKHSRATSSSDTQSVEGDEKKKAKHRSKKSTESKELVESNTDGKDESDLPTSTPIITEPESTETNAEVQSCHSKKSDKPVTDDTPMSTTNEEAKDDTVESTQNIESDKKNDNEANSSEGQNVSEAKDTEKQNENKAINTKKQNENEVKSTDKSNENKTENTDKSNENEAKNIEKQDENEATNTDEQNENKAKDTYKKLENKAKVTDKQNENKAKDIDKLSENKAKDTEKQHENNAKKSEKEVKTSDADTTVVSPKPPLDESESVNVSLKDKSPERKRSVSMEKSEILEIHAEDSHCESTEIVSNESQTTSSNIILHQDKEGSNIVAGQVSNNEITTEMIEKESSSNESTLITTIKNVVESTKIIELENKTEVSNNLNKEPSKDSEQTDEGRRDENNQNTQEVPNGQVTPLVINRKRRWGSRPSRLSTQKSITISTDVLKEIIPDVKPAEFDEVIEEKKHKRVEVPEKIDRPVLPKIVIDNTEHIEMNKDQKMEDKDKENVKSKETNIASMRKISIVKDNDSIITRPPSPPRHKQSNILYITNLVRPFTLPQLKNLLQRTGRIVENEFWMDKIKSKCFVKYENEDQAVETRHALHGVTWPVSNPKTLHVDFSTQEDFDKAKANEDTDNAKQSTIPGTVEDWLLEQDMKREKGELEKPWERKIPTREWDVGKNDKGKDIARQDKEREERPMDKRRHRTPERSPEPARKFKKKEEEAPAKLLDDLFRKTKTTPCIYWLPLSAETIAVKEEQRRLHMAEHERRLQELRRTHRRH